ncbi:hypothetical protein AMD27_04580 [Acinetobacter sp. TGL-Y2]|nr:hypothetical protein AMD27_04580 [Acinetobacter sp. TGL-Y2]
MILISSIWQATQREAQDFSILGSDVQNIELNTNHMYIGDAESIDQILVSDLKSIKKLMTHWQPCLYYKNLMIKILSL